MSAAAWAVGPGRVLAEVVLPLLAMVGRFADRPGEVEPLEPLDTALLELTEGAAPGVLGGPRQPADLLGEQATASAYQITQVSRQQSLGQPRKMPSFNDSNRRKPLISSDLMCAG